MCYFENIFYLIKNIFKIPGILKILELYLNIYFEIFCFNLSSLYSQQSNIISEDYVCSISPLEKIVS